MQFAFLDFKASYKILEAVEENYFSVDLECSYLERGQVTWWKDACEGRVGKG